jgi:DNA-binding MarR family transcriptional regulator
VTQFSAQCAAKIIAVVPLITRVLRAEMRHHGQPRLSLSQLRVLHFLKRKPQSSLSDLADYLDVTRPTMSVMVERLVQRGFVHRIDNENERRRVVLTLTSAGISELEAVYNATLANIADRLEALSGEQCQQVMAGLSILEGLFADVEAAAKK